MVEAEDAAEEIYEEKEEEMPQADLEADPVLD